MAEKKSKIQVEQNTKSPNLRKIIKKKETISTINNQINRKYLFSEKDKSNLFIKNLLNKIEIFLNNEIYLKTDSHIVLAVSGGVDSISMLDIFVNLSQKYPLMKLSVVHFNHKLRGKASEGDELFVEKISKKYNIPFFKANGNVNHYAKTKGYSIETAARVLRYRFFERISKKIDAEYVATAHTADDSAETFFLNLFRGTGITGLSGIPVRRTLIKRISVIRPLLELRKKELIDYARLRNLEWREDESNIMLNFTRNKIRHELIPNIESQFSPLIVESINRTQKLFQGADNLISRYIQKSLQGLISNKSPGKFGIKIPVFQTFDDFLKGEILHKIISNNFQLPNLSMQTIDRIIKLVDKPIGSVCEINKSYIVVKDREVLTFARREDNVSFNVIIKKEGEFEAGDFILTLTKLTKKQVKFSGDLKIEYLDWDLIPSILHLRTWEHGDTFVPLGMEGSMKISDFLTNKKISILDKGKVLLLASKSDIIWVCGMRVSNKYKITDKTTNYLKVEFHKITNKDEAKVV